MEQLNIPGAKMKHNRILLFGTIILVSFIIMGNIKAAPEITLISNTDFCDEICQATYKLCDTKLDLKTELKLKDDFNIVYSDSKEQLKESIKSLKSKEIITEKLGPGCFLVTIDGIKDKFANIDHVLYYDGIYYKEFAWWNSTFTRKKMYNITTNSGTTPSNFQIHLNISYESDMQPDFDDIRFLDSTETNQLVYWISNKTDSSYANVWIKSNTSISTAITTIWLYYGNPATTSESNGFDTFLMFDDFEDGDNTTRVLWSQGYTVGNCGFAVQNFQGSYIQNISAVAAFAECSIKGGTIPLRNYVMEMDIYQDYDENAAGYGPKHGTAESTSQRTFVAIFRPENDIGIGRVNGGFDGWLTLTTDAIPSVNVLDQWIHFKDEFTQAATNISTYISHGKGNFNTIFQGMLSSASFNNNGSIEITAIRGTAYYDNILIREYFPGQIIYVPGMEQTKAINIIVPQNISYYSGTIDLITSATDFIPDLLYYSLNGGTNISFTSPTNFSAILGNNNIIVWAYENETDTWYSDSEYFVAIFVPTTQGNVSNVSITFNVDANADTTITEYSCSNNNTLKIDSNIRYCAGAESESPVCYWVNKTKYQTCEYGCYDGVVENGSYCSPPDYILWGFGLIMFFVAIFLINRYYRGG